MYTVAKSQETTCAHANFIYLTTTKQGIQLLQIILIGTALQMPAVSNLGCSSEQQTHYMCAVIKL